MKELNYPFDPEFLIKKKKSIKKKLVGDINGNNYLEKNIAILGGSTTNDIKLILELFLLNYGIKPSFYESEYNQFYEDGMFPNPELEKFSPDIIYICTSNRNVIEYPLLSDNEDQIEQKLADVVDKFSGLWEQLRETYHCPVIQNNFEYPFFRLMGNKYCKEIYEKLIQYLVERGIEVELYLCPLAPSLWDRIKAEELEYPILSELEDYGKSIAEKYDLKIAGSYNPYNLLKLRT